MTDTHTATVTAGQLRRMLDDAARTSCTDDTLPMICGVLLYTADKAGSPVLVATSTDRFTLGQIHTPATGRLPEVFVPLDEAKKASKALALVDTSLPAALSTTDTTLQVVTDGLSIALRLYVSGRKDGGTDFPKSAKLFDTDRNTDEQRVMVSAELLAKFMPIAKARGVHQANIRVELNGVDRPIHVHIGDSYRALVMPVKERADEHVRVPLFVAPSELAAIEKAKADKAAAETKAAAEKSAAELKAKRSAAAKKAAATRAAKRATTPTRTTRKQAA